MLSYNYIEKICENKTFPFSIKNEYGQNIIIEKDGDTFKVTTYQQDNWLKVEYYYPNKIKEI